MFYKTSPHEKFEAKRMGSCMYLVVVRKRARVYHLEKREQIDSAMDSWRVAKN